MIARFQVKVAREVESDEQEVVFLGRAHDVNLLKVVNAYLHRVDSRWGRAGLIAFAQDQRGVQANGLISAARRQESVVDAARVIHDDREARRFPYLFVALIGEDGRGDIQVAGGVG